MDLSGFNNIALLAFLAPVAAFWNHIKSFIYRIFSFVVRTDTIVYYIDSKNFLDYLLETSKIVRWGNSSYKTHHKHVSKLGSWHDILFGYHKEFIVLVGGKIPILIAPSGWDGNGIKITYILGLFNMAAKLAAAQDRAIKRFGDKVYPGFNIRDIYGENKVSVSLDAAQLSKSVAPSSSNDGLPFNDGNFLEEHNKWVGFNHDELQPPLDNPNQKTYYWQPEAKRLKKEIEFWINSQEWYQDRSIPWKRSAILHGKPGCGKSKMIQEVAKSVKFKNSIGMKVNILHIDNMSNNEFVAAIKESNGCIVVIEDIDVHFDGRKNLNKSNLSNPKNLLSFDCLINTICGIKEDCNCFIIVTTNKIETVDPALLRAGRLDAKIEVGPLNKEGKQFLASNILKDWPDLVDKMADLEEALPVVEFQNRCVELAIEKFNKSNCVEVNL